MLKRCLMVSLSIAALTVSAQDVEREARWRAQVEPTLVIGEAVAIPGPAQRPFLGILTEPANVDRANTTLLVIVHGLGVHPDHGIIGRLRMDLADAGFATLSIQMPVLASDAAPDLYPPLFGHAAERIGQAAEWARAKGYRDLVLVSHSMGSRMANAYFDRTVTPAYRAWVALGLGAPFSPVFAKAPPVPVLDVLGERDFEPVLKTAAARAAVAQASGARQLRISGADHFYAGQEVPLIRSIAEFARKNAQRR